MYESKSEGKLPLLYGIAGRIAVQDQGEDEVRTLERMADPPGMIRYCKTYCIVVYETKGNEVLKDTGEKRVLADFPDLERALIWFGKQMRNSTPECRPLNFGPAFKSIRLGNPANLFKGNPNPTSYAYI